MAVEASAIVMMTEMPGADAAFAEGMRHAGIIDALQAARGFRGHWSGATSSGYKVFEFKMGTGWDTVTDTRRDCCLQMPPVRRGRRSAAT